MIKAEEASDISKARTVSLRAGSWSMKLLYLAFFGYIGINTAYLGPYLAAIGLDGTQIGLITSILPLAIAITQPLWGIMSDRYGQRKLLLGVTLLIAALIALVIPAIRSFYGLLVPIIIFAIAVSPASPLADAMTLQWIDEHGGSYGAIRIYGTIGFLLASLIAGEFFASHSILNLFFLMSIVLGTTFLVSLAVPGTSTRVRTPRAKSSGLKIILHDRVIVLFLLISGLGYSTFQGYGIFFSLYLQTLGAGPTLVGIAIALTAFCELPAMAFVGRMIRNLGIKRLLLLGWTIATIRWLAYAAFPNLILAFILQSLHGISFTAFYVAALTFIDRRVPEDLRTTGQTLFYGATFGIGSWFGATFFGLLYDHLGGRGMFLAAGITSIFALIGSWLVMSQEKILPISHLKEETYEELHR